MFARHLALATYGATWFLVAALRPPLLWVLPLEHTVAWEVPLGSVGMDFHARVVVALVAALAAWGAGRWVEGRLEPARRDVWARRALTWALSAIVLAGSMEVVVLSRRAPVPWKRPAASVTGPSTPLGVTRRSANGQCAQAGRSRGAAC